jgi:hypothetical protein
VAKSFKEEKNRLPCVAASAKKGVNPMKQSRVNGYQNNFHF